MNGPDEIRRNIVNWILSGNSIYEYHDRDVLIDELCFFERKNRADLVYANGKLTAFEIKSKADTLTRWQSQCSAYLKVFDAVWLCCHNKHALKSIEVTPKDVGIIIVDDTKSGLAILRDAKINKSIDSYYLSDLLWRSELDELCVENNLKVIRKEKIKEVRARISNELPLDIIRQKVLQKLKIRYK
ncbi:sce7726 family protein [Orbaceae bacterium ac157xtp]